MRYLKSIIIALLLVNISLYAQVTQPKNAILKLSVDTHGKITISDINPIGIKNKKATSVKNKSFTGGQIITLQNQAIFDESIASSNYSNWNKYQNKAIEKKDIYTEYAYFKTKKNNKPSIKSGKLSISNSTKLKEQKLETPLKTLLVAPNSLPNLHVYTGTDSFNAYYYDSDTDVLSIFASIGNNGQAIALPFKVGFYLSSNTTITTNDILLGRYDIAWLDNGFFKNISKSTTLTSLNLDEGTYYVGIICDDTKMVFELNENDNAEYFTESLYYETLNTYNLYFYSGEGSETSYEYNSSDQELTINSSIANGGSAPIEAFDIGYYLSTDISLESNDIYLKTLRLENLGSNKYKNTTVTVDINSHNIAEGSYYIFVIADSKQEIDETSEADNGIYFNNPFTYAPIKYPNLSINTGENAENTYSYNSETKLLTINVSIENSGEANAERFRTGFYLIDNDSVSETMYLMAIEFTESLNQNNYINLSTTIKLDSSELTSGIYYACAIFDDLFEITESNESDNGIIFTDGFYYSEPTYANLIIYNGEGAVNGYIYDSTSTQLNTYACIGNNDVEDANTFRVGFYIIEASESADIILIDTTTIESLTSASYLNIESEVVLNNLNINEGTYFVAFISDDLNTVVESDESDNAAIFNENIMYSFPELANLFIYTGDESNNSYNLNAANTLTISTSIANNGTAKAENFKVGFYLSENESIESLYTLVSSETISSLESGYYKTIESSKNLDELNLPNGDYYLWVICDNEFIIEESDELDNVIYFNSPLNYEEITFPNICCYMGAGANNSFEYDLFTNNLEANICVANKGNCPAQNVKVSLYISTNNEIDLNDNLLISKTINTLNANSHTNIAFSLDLDDFPIISDTYYVGYYFDNENDLEEESENDNTYCYENTINFTPTTINMNKHMGFTASPNPTNNYLNITSTSNISTEITIYNIIGEVLHSSVLTSLKTKIINLSKYPQGVYFIEQKHHNYVLSKKVLKQ